ncbi:MAG: peptide-methionine (R)-S-oxide reductase MsrB [Candidatus Cyclobacteriaceae bacterium M2_1C_046]
MSYKINKSEKEWKKELTPEEYHVLREKGTERAFSGDLNKIKKEGVFICAACENEVFTTEAKYESHSGWPSFYKPISMENVEVVKDYSHGMVRDEVLCARCGGHLGHVFDDGPKPTGLRYCINSIAMDFKEEEKK